METAEVSGHVELGRWCAMPDDTEVWLQSTKNPRRFLIRKRPKEKRANRVRHRRVGQDLTPGEQFGNG